MKVFGIGLSKTGTSSLNEALNILGFNTIHNPSSYLYLDERGAIALDFKCVDKSDGITDTEAAFFFGELDRQFQGSKFILTTRERNQWLQSCKNHFNRHLNSNNTDNDKKLLEAIYGSYLYDKTLFTKAYSDHERRVKCFFKNRPNDLLVLDLADRDKMEKICLFLNCELPEVSYPKVNVSFPMPLMLKEILRRSDLLILIRNKFRR